MFSHTRRWFIIPALLVLGAGALILADIITIETDFPVDTITYVMMGLAALTLLAVFGLEIRGIVRSWEMPEPEDPPQTDYIIEPTPLDDAEESVEQVEDFSKRATERVMIDIDIEDSRDD